MLASALAAMGKKAAVPPPRIVGIVSLSEREEELEDLVRGFLVGGADRVVAASNRNDATATAGVGISITCAYDAHQKGGSSPHMTLLANHSSFRHQYHNKYAPEDASVHAALDLCRICDLVLFLVDGSSVTSTAAIAGSGGSTIGGGIGGGIDGMVHVGNIGGAHSVAATSVKTSAGTAHLDHLISDRGDRILTAIKAQGLPTPVTVVVHSNGGNGEENNGIGGTGSGSGGRGIGSVVGGMIGGGGMMQEDDHDDEDDEDEGEEECAMMSIGMSSFRSTKSIRRSYVRRRAELKRYVSRFAVTEFGENSKVTEIDLSDSGNPGTGSIMSVGATTAMMEEDDDEADNAKSSNMTTSSSTIMTMTTTMTNKTSQSSCTALIRMLCTIAASGPSWVTDSPRPFLLTDGTANATSSIKAPHNQPAVQYDATRRELKLTGYIRGNNTPWNVNHLAHVPHLGTYAVKNVVLAGVGEEMLPPIVAAGRKNRIGGGAKSSGSGSGSANVDMKDEGDNTNAFVLAEADPEERESLEMFASPDALEGEQNLIGFDHDEDGLGNLDEEDDDQEEGNNQEKAFQPGTSRPAGWSDYQSAWLDAIGDNEDNEDHGELAFALNKKKGDATTVGGDDILMDDDDDEEVNAEGKRAMLRRRKKDRDDDLEFPDEVAVEDDGNARDRYARYRSLKSFRNSHWDPKENLPDTYGAVYHFANFKATQKDVMLDMKEMKELTTKRGCGAGGGKGKDGKGKDGDVDMEDDDDSLDEEDEAMIRACIPCGAYVTITLEGVSPSSYSRVSPDTILTAVSLLPHENKISVLHMGLSQSSKCERDEEIPVKSKDVLTFRCGWRTWQNRPVFSQNNLNCDKHKFERFMPTNGAFFATTVFGPVTYAPCPVLMFRESAETGEDHGGDDGKRRELLAHGSMIGADADRIVMKRIILTGYPTRVHKRHATVKYMFYNPDDVRVRVELTSFASISFFVPLFLFSSILNPLLLTAIQWFQPAGLTTKHGLQGNIVESNGEHGTMKCLFNAPIKQHDTVCLPLYKRMFPKFAPTGQDQEEGGGPSMSKQIVVL